VTDFEPATDLPDHIDPDDNPVASTARSRDEAIQRRRHRVLVALVIVIAVGLAVAGFTLWRVAVSALAMYLLLRLGFAVLGAFARPIPDAPPAGELRRVKLKYRCNVCGTEIRMTLANDEVPEPPRHCTEDMEPTATEDDAL
jgi:uncharacterized protein (DUF983 family)